MVVIFQAGYLLISFNNKFPFVLSSATNSLQDYHNPSRLRYIFMIEKKGITHFKSSPDERSQQLVTPIEDN